MGRLQTRYSRVPWWLPDSDLCEQGEPEWVRDCLHERQIGMHVLASDGRTSLGVLALRCLRRGDSLTPLSLVIAETPAVEAPVPVRQRWAPRRRHITHDDEEGSWDGEP